MDNFKINPKKERNNVFLYRMMYCFVLALLALGIIFLVTGGAIFTGKYLFIFTLCVIPACVLYAFAVEKLGTSVGGLLLGWTGRKIMHEEQFSADMAKARFCKGKGQYKEANIIISEILKKHPQFPEALLLKAQIVWEGYRNSELALRNLDRVLELVKDDDPIRKWAVNYYHDVKKSSRDKQ